MSSIVFFVCIVSVCFLLLLFVFHFSYCQRFGFFFLFSFCQLFSLPLFLNKQQQQLFSPLFLNKQQHHYCNPYPTCTGGDGDCFGSSVGLPFWFIVSGVVCGVLCIASLCSWLRFVIVLVVMVMPLFSRLSCRCTLDCCLSFLSTSVSPSLL